MMSDDSREITAGQQAAWLRTVRQASIEHVAQSVGIEASQLRDFENDIESLSNDTHRELELFFGVPLRGLRFSPRAMMQKAIDEMRQSVHESREDGKINPSVGAVLLTHDPQHRLQTAHRGELRFGDHAEFTLLERKNRGRKLDGSILFATLEPCAPDARNHPKLGCAERIVLARIAEVWVGIEDPDPTVDRKGIKFLEDNGIVVHMFDRDLQEQIREFNAKFLKQARGRAEEEDTRKVVTLSSFEQPHLESDLNDFAPEAIERYRDLAGIPKAGESSEAFKRSLLRSELLQREEDGQIVPSGFGLLLFGRSPRDVFPQAGLLATVTYPNGKEEQCTFDEPLVLIPELLEKWVRTVLPRTIDRNAMVRKEELDFPFQLIREAVINALVHRDYDIKQAKCQLEITSDTITIRSPGEPVSPITLEQLQQFNAPMLSRNPKLHRVLSQMKMAEERGLGMKTWRSIPEKYGLPLPSYRQDGPYLVLTLYRTSESVEGTLRPEVLADLSNSERDGWRWLATKDVVTAAEYADAVGLAKRTAGKHLKQFRELGLITSEGSGPSTRYRVNHS